MRAGMGCTTCPCSSYCWADELSESMGLSMGVQREAPVSRISLLPLPSRVNASFAVQNSWSWESASLAVSKPARVDLHNHMSKHLFD